MKKLRIITLCGALVIVLFSGLNYAGAVPNIFILGNTAVVGLTATTTANANFTASGTVAFVTLASAGSPCLVVGTTGLISTSTCGGSSFTTTTINGLSSTAYTFAVGSGGIVITTSSLGTVTFQNSGLLSLTVGASGLVLSSATGTPTLQFSGVSSLTGSTGLVVSNSTGTITLQNSGLLSVSAGSNITVSSATGTPSIAVTSTPTFGTTTLSTGGVIVFPDATRQTTAHKDYAFNVYNASTTQNGVSSTIQKLFIKASTLVQVDCSTDGASVTLVSDVRVSSTPQTYGTQTFNGTGIVCTSAGATTSTFSNAAIAANTVLNFGINVVPNATTTLRVNFRTKEQ